MYGQVHTRLTIDTCKSHGGDEGRWYWCKRGENAAKLASKFYANILMKNKELGVKELQSQVELEDIKMGNLTTEQHQPGSFLF